MIIIISLAIIGFCLSAYSYFVEKKVQAEPDYKAACDISDKISCTQVAKSPYTKLLFFSNSVIGMVYYVLVALCAALQAHDLLLVLTIAGAIASAVLAYILYVKIKKVCIVCTAVYV